jgi:DNA-directed RNA polymerase subunit omega
MTSSNEPTIPQADKLDQFELGRFVLSNLAAKRAKQLREGAPPLVRTDSNNPLTIALAEIAQGMIKPNLPEVVEELAGSETLLISDDMPEELGFLLPSLEDAEVDLFAMGLDDHDEDHEESELSLSDLGDDLAIEDDAVVPEETVDAEDGTLSLTDIAEQEEQDAADDQSDE